MNPSAPPPSPPRSPARVLSTTGGAGTAEALRRGRFAALAAFAAASMLCGGLGAVVPAWGDERSLESLEERLLAAYDRVHQPIWDLSAAFAAALERMLAQETAAGNLDSTLEIQNEIAAFGDGRDFDAETFLRRPAGLEALTSAKAIYARERERLWNEGARARAELLGHYATALSELESDLTREARTEEALRVRRAREGLDADPRFSGDTKRSFDERPFTGRIHIVAKGDIQIEHNGNRVNVRNTSSERSKYVFGSSRDMMVAAGDVILVRMRSTVVYRSFILSIESADGAVFVPFAVDDFRYLGEGRDAAQIASDREELLRIVARPERGGPDPDMTDAWRKMPLSQPAQAASEWVRCGPGTEWHHYAAVIRPEMLKATELPTEDR